MALTGHRGAHTKKYKQFVLDRLEDATDGLTGKEALTNALNGLRGFLSLKDLKMYLNEIILPDTHLYK